MVTEILPIKQGTYFINNIVSLLFRRISRNSTFFRKKFAKKKRCYSGLSNFLGELETVGGRYVGGWIQVTNADTLVQKRNWLQNFEKIVFQDFKRVYAHTKLPKPHRISFIKRSFESYICLQILSKKKFKKIKYFVFYDGFCKKSHSKYSFGFNTLLKKNKAIAATHPKEQNEGRRITL